MNKGTIQTVGNMFTLSAGDDIGSKTQCLSYDAKNRPASFRDVSTGTLVECAYDCHGRRCTKKVTVAGTATRPLTFRYAEKSLMLFYAFDGNKNVSDVFFLALQNGIGAHYEYAPFGAVTRTAKATSSKVDLIGANPWRFSSEFYDSELDLVYYNYRHYSPALGRFLSRDPIQEQGGLNLYAFVGNHIGNSVDILGKWSLWECIKRCLGFKSSADDITKYSVAMGVTYLGAECIRFRNRYMQECIGLDRTSYCKKLWNDWQTVCKMASEAANIAQS